MNTKWRYLRNVQILMMLLLNWRTGGVKEVLLTLGDKGSLIYVDERFYEIPAYPVENVADATGCGDTYMAGYLYMRKRGASYQEAGCFCRCHVFRQTTELRSVRWNGGRRT